MKEQLLIQTTTLNTYMDRTLNGIRRITCHLIWKIRLFLGFGKQKHHFATEKKTPTTPSYKILGLVGSEKKTKYIILFVR